MNLTVPTLCAGTISERRAVDLALALALAFDVDPAFDLSPLRQAEWRCSSGG
jgi:hypothetical protein